MRRYPHVQFIPHGTAKERLDRMKAKRQAFYGDLLIWFVAAVCVILMAVNA